MKNVKVTLNLLTVFVHLYRRKVNWCFTVFITFNILLWLENIFLFDLVSMICIFGSVAVRKRYPYSYPALKKQ